MSLCVLGKESLDELERLVIPLFVGVSELEGVVRKEWQQHPYGPDQLGYRLDVAPVKDIRSLSINFPIHDCTPHYRAQPAGYISEREQEDVLLFL